MTYKLGFIGTGVMAGAILSRALFNGANIGLKPEEILVYDLDTNKTDAFAKQGVCVASSENDVFTSCECVLLGVKPQFFPDMIAKVSEVKAKTIISIMAGIEISVLRKSFPAEVGFVRVMPNTPCKIGKGVMALCFDKVDDITHDFVLKVFGSCGKTLELEESKFHAVTGISGSGPAYLYMFANALIKSGMDAGLTEEESKVLTYGMIEGSSEYARLAEIPLDTMVEMVCSKGGTTIEAVNFFKQKDLDGTVLGAVRACIKRSKEISEGK